MDFVRRALLRKEAKIYEFFERDTVQTLINDHLQGKKIGDS